MIRFKMEYKKKDRKRRKKTYVSKNYSCVMQLILLYRINYYTHFDNTV